MNRHALLTCALTVLLGAPLASGQAVRIDFDDLPSITEVTDQYPWVEFSSDPGFANKAFLGSSHFSPPNILCTGIAGGGHVDCAQNTYIDFLRPVNDLKIMAIGVNDAGVVARARVFENGILTDTLDLSGPNQFQVDLSPYTDVTRLELVDIVDFAGMGWDDLEFSIDPEVWIDFDDLSSITELTTQYPGLSFSSEPGFTNYVFNSEASQSAPNILCTGPATGGIDCDHDTYVDFDRPVSHVRITAIGVNDANRAATVNVFLEGVLLGQVDVVGGGGSSKVPVDLSAFPCLDRLELVDLDDFAGVGWDDLKYRMLGSAENYGDGHPGTLGVPSIQLVGQPVVGGDIEIQVANSQGSSTVALLYTGLAAADEATSKDGRILVVPFLSRFLPIPTSGLSLAGTLPNNSALCGLDVYYQALMADGGASKGIAFTPGLRLSIGE